MTSRDDCSSWATAFDGMPILRPLSLAGRANNVHSRSLGVCIFEGIMKAPMYVGGLSCQGGKI